MRQAVFFDTSAIYAYINRKDPDHLVVAKAVSSCKGKLIISNYIFDEIVTLVSSRLGHVAASQVGTILMNAPQIERAWLTRQDEVHAWTLFHDRPDKNYSFTDCTSFVLMRRLGVKKYLALDDHFRQEGFSSVIV
jgi:predicted nucleic acid-binding protein